MADLPAKQAVESGCPRPGAKSSCCAARRRWSPATRRHRRRPGRAPLDPRVVDRRPRAVGDRECPRWRRCRSGKHAESCRRHRRGRSYAALTLMHALVSCVEVPDRRLLDVDRAGVLDVDADVGKRGRTRHARDIESAQRDVVPRAGIDHDAGRRIAGAAQHADAAIDAGGANDLDRLVDRHRTVARGVEDHDLAAAGRFADRGVEAAAGRGQEQRRRKCRDRGRNRTTQRTCAGRRRHAATDTARRPERPHVRASRRKVQKGVALGIAFLQLSRHVESGERTRGRGASCKSVSPKGPGGEREATRAVRRGCRRAIANRPSDDEEHMENRPNGGSTMSAS